MLTRFVKAQSAIEYLVTYGWMLIAVAIAGGAVYPALTPECVESTTGFQSQSINLQNFGPNTDNELELVVENQRSDQITVKKITAGLADSDVNITNNQDVNVMAGATNSTNVGYGISSSAEDCTTFEVEIEYSIGPLENQKATGTVTGPIDVILGEAPGSPRNFEVSQNPIN